ncbi:MAG: glycosyltransferase, partial [Nitrososphaerales archaeon]
GVPIVASNTGAIPEILERGKFGLLFDSGDVNSLAQRIQEAISDEKGAAMRAEDAKASLNKYAWANVAKDTLRVYREILSK